VLKLVKLRTTFVSFISYLAAVRAHQLGVQDDSVINWILTGVVDQVTLPELLVPNTCVPVLFLKGGSHKLEIGKKSCTVINNAFFLQYFFPLVFL
jgi:hypothetical protein